ncbi:MAG: hypothetical protein HZB39_11670 [Planctomycetes bacterium]|nr:hypothetical protein [Planctomycetota bacterium]
MTPSPRSLLLCAVVAALGAHGVVAQDLLDDKAWKKALATYQEWVQRPSLYKRTLARQTLAQTLDPRAFDILVKSYSKPEDPIDANRYLIASIATRTFRSHADEAALLAWRKKHGKAEDSWLWFESQRASAAKFFDDLRAQALGKGDPFLRAVALEALADAAQKGSEAEKLAELCLEVLDTLPEKDLERALLTESVARTLHVMRRQVRGTTWRTVAEALIRQFDAPEMPARTKVVVSRYLSDIFGVSNLGFESRWWRTELDRDIAHSKPVEGKTTTVPFFSIRSVGYRFVYVIDASDSMCKRVSDREKKEIPTAGPSTGEGSKPKPKPGEDAGFVPKETDLDWSRIVTRFDVGREFVRLSLRSLQPEHHFAVVLFGDEAEPLNATPKLVPASPQNVRAAIAELDAIHPGSPIPDRPDGVIRGRTNLHAGFARAFEITKAGDVKRSEYVDARALMDGCDSIFLLSDGAPSWDDYPALDKRDPTDQAGDPESGIQHQNVDQLLFQGPYAHPPFEWLAQDIERMNLFRKAEIHCVGIGEASHDLLSRIARIGNGKALKIQGDIKPK